MTTLAFSYYKILRSIMQPNARRTGFKPQDNQSGLVLEVRTTRTAQCSSSDK